MEYAELLKQIQNAPGFDLLRLHTAIGLMLDDPKRVFHIRKSLQVGEQIEYFEASENRAIKATILKFQRTRVAVENLEDKKRWSIPYIAINTPALDQLQKQAQPGNTGNNDLHTLKDSSVINEHEAKPKHTTHRS